MKLLRNVLAAAALAGVTAARAVYAPIPEQEQGKGLIFSTNAGITYDSNIFGAPTHAIDSVIWEIAPGVAFNVSASDTTFASASYRLTLDYFDNRPTKKLLDSHSATARLAHSFSKTSTLDFTDAFTLSHNPESLLAGTPLNSDQSNLTNQVDGRFGFSPAEKLDVVFKAREIYYDYLSTVLGNLLNRNEFLEGVEASYSVLPELKAAMEVRHQDVEYVSNGSSNDKHSEFIMAGPDYQLGPKVSASVRVGAEFRELSGAPSQTAPYAEVSGKYVYGTQSYVTLGYIYSLAETSDPIDYLDERSNRIFVSVQQALTANVIASATADVEPAELVGRPGVYNLHETANHAGGALSYVFNPHVTVAATYDYDLVDSGLAYRGMKRSRAGVSAHVSF